MMCSWRSSLIRSIIAASVVDLPEPVGPVTSTKPRGFLVNSSSTGGRPSCSSAGISLGIRRKAAPTRGALEVGVDAEAGPAGDRVGEVDLPLVLQPLPLVVGEDRVDDLARVLRGQRRVVERVQLPVLADHRREPAVRWRSEAPAPSPRSGRLRSRSPSSLLIGSSADHVTRATSAMDVMPCLTFSKPSSRSGRMPCATATSRISSAGRALDRQVADLVARSPSPRRGRSGPCSRSRRSARSRPARRPRCRTRR